MKNKNNKRVALFVGVDKYTDAAIHPLAGAVADARALHEFFSSRRNQFDNAVLMENPTSEAIIDKLDEIQKELSAGDFLLFFFAGHGMDVNGRQQLVCFNSRLRGAFLSNSFDPENIRENHEDLNIAIVLDACRTPLERKRGASTRTADRRDIDYYGGFVARHNGGSGSIGVLCSCDEGKAAGEVAKDGSSHGLFTLGLLDVLSRADAEHRAWLFNQDLADEIGIAMDRLDSGAGGGQRPWIKASGKPSVLFLPSMDTTPLKKWVLGLSQSDAISSEIAGECLKALEGKSDRPGASGIFEAICFFSRWEDARKRGEPPEQTVVAILEALCRTEYRVEKTKHEKQLAKSPKPKASPSILDSEAPLTSRDRELLSDVESRLRAIGDDDVDFSGIARMTQSEAVHAVNAIARKRMRQMCGRVRFNALYTKNERDSWSMMARKGFGSLFESAIYELVLDEKAYSLRK